jgi:hypothetical protein
MSSTIVEDTQTTRIGPNILRVVSKEVEALQSQKTETTYKCAAYYDCEWHDSGTGDCEDK